MTGHLRARLAGLTLLAVPALAQVVPDLYIVELTGSPAISDQAKFNRRARLAAEQSAARLAIRTAGGEVVSSLETVVNALVVRIPDVRSGELARLTGVAKVHPVREARLELDQAIPLNRVTEAWKQIGGSAGAGLGVKIGLIDTGVDSTHPGLTDSTLAAIEGYPKTRSASDEASLSSKIIVMRNYQSLIDPTVELDPRDHNGHGTAVAMAAAGMPVSGPYAELTGVAPKAYLGIYKVFPGANGNTTEDAVLKALDDAVADGMDIVNISLGLEPTQRPADDLMVSAIEKASQAGVIIVKSAGNSGSLPNTITSPGTAPSAITVGAQRNQRDFAAPAAMVGGKSYEAIAGSGLNSKTPIEAPLTDVAALDGGGKACAALAEESLRGRIALILRGDCTFEEKLNYAGKAGAVAALVYSDPDRPSAAAMSTGSATLPAVMVSNADGAAIKQQLAKTPDLAVRLRFELEAVASNPLRLASFSSRGPTPSYAIKPDLVAAGYSITTATQSLDSKGDLYSLSKYVVVAGTSFSSPIVAGAAAVVKSARPGLKPAQYRSLLINSAAPLAAEAGGQNAAQQAGAGMLNLDSALRNTITAEPVSISFGAGQPSAAMGRELTVTNLASEPDVLTITVEPFTAGTAPVVSSSQFSLEAGASKLLTLDWNATGATAGEYQGVVRVRGARSGVDTRIPYWYAAPSGQPEHIHVITSSSSSSSSTATLYVRVTDSSGVVISDLQPKATVVSGSGTVTGTIQSLDALYPGYWLVRVERDLQGSTVVRIEFGPASKDVTVKSGG